MDLYEELTGRAPASTLVDISGADFYGPGYEDSSRLPPDITKLRRLGWAPRHDVRTTFRDAMAYYVDQSLVDADRLEARHVLGATLSVGADLHPGRASA